MKISDCLVLYLSLWYLMAWHDVNRLFSMLGFILQPTLQIFGWSWFVGSVHPTGSLIKYLNLLPLGHLNRMAFH
jgi:hypothetical protein